MTAEELRIGNKLDCGALHLPYGIGEVIEICVDCLTMRVNGRIETYPFDGLKEIPLTEEWLLKARFERVGNDWFEIGDHFYPVGFNNDGELIIMDWDNPVIKYVHQLQNLYFALTNQEIAFK